MELKAQQHAGGASRDSHVRWGVIGCGNIAGRFARSLAHVPNASLAAVWSRRPEAVAAFVAEHGGSRSDHGECVAAATVEELLLQLPDITAIYIATLPDSHAEYSVAALRAGKAVLCEKPSAPSAVELSRILAVARAEGRLWMEALKVPFYPLYRELSRLLRGAPDHASAAGAAGGSASGIGQVRFVRAGSSLTGVDPAHPSFSLELAGGALLSIGVYGAFLATEWLGPAVKVDATGRIDATGVDVFAAVQTTHAVAAAAAAGGGGATLQAQAQTYCGLDLLGPGEALLSATGGYARIHEPWWNPSRATVQPAGGGAAVELDVPFEHGGLVYEIEHFCGLLRAGIVESAVMSHERSREIMAVLDGAKESAFGTCVRTGSSVVARAGEEIRQPEI
jgi:predicted dehydrogenase